MNYDISIIIPFLNEEDNIQKLTNELNSYISSLNDISFEVILVDDGSTDNSLGKLKELQSLVCDCKILKLSQNFGAHAALRAGILHSKGKYTSFMYADLQDPLTLITSLYNKCMEGNDIVWGTRRTDERKLLSGFYAKIMQKIAIKNFPEKGFDIVMFSEKIKAELNSNIEANSSVFLQILSLGFTQDSVEYVRDKREFGKTKWTFFKKLKLFIDSLVAFSYVPIRFVSVMGFTLFILGSSLTVYIILRALLANDLAQGWPSLIAILMTGFGLTNISLGIIAEYLWRTLDASRNRKVFIIEDIIEKQAGK